MGKKDLLMFKSRAEFKNEWKIAIKHISGVREKTSGYAISEKILSLN